MSNVESNFRPVEPVRPVAPYIGGKRNLAGRLVELIEATPHTTYAEPFVGMGGVFLRRRLAPRAEVINDLSGDVAGFFRVLQRHYVAFLEMLRFQITSRREFERLGRTDPTTLTDLERAARFLYLQRTAFGGKVSGRTFGVAVERPGRFDVTRLQPMLEALHERLAGVVIECLPYGEFIARYDRPGTLFYLDPPYEGSEDDYGKGVFGRADFEALSAQLAGIRGRFVLSINDTKPVRAAFEDFLMTPVKTTYTLAKGAAAPARELIVTGPNRVT
ncbi:MAG: DNA adenine methylase [Gammaproteobacteria bacterium]